MAIFEEVLGVSSGETDQESGIKGANGESFYERIGGTRRAVGGISSDGGMEDRALQRFGRGGRAERAGEGAGGNSAANEIIPGPCRPMADGARFVGQQEAKDDVSGDGAAEFADERITECAGAIGLKAEGEVRGDPGGLFGGEER